MSRIVLSLTVFSLLIVAATVHAQTYESGTVLRWESGTYSQSAHITRNHIVYSVRMGKMIYQIARRSDKVEMTVGQQLKCRADKGHFFVLSEKGKETKYDIVGVDSTPESKLNE